MNRARGASGTIPAPSTATGPAKAPRGTPGGPPTKAMVLAAGLGARMKPLSSLRPKPALPALNRPLIAHCLAHLSRHGVTEVVVNTHHLPQALQEAVERHLPVGMVVTFSHERSILGTAGGLKKAGRQFEGGTFYLVNSDSLTDADLGAAAAAHAASGRAATMIVIPHDPRSGYRPVGVAPSDSETSRVASIAGRQWGAQELRQRTFTGVHVLEPRVLDAIPSGNACDINADIYPWLLDEDAESVGAWLHDGWWSEAGSPARYLELNLELLARSGRGAVVGPGFFIDEEARVERAVIGERARLARGCSVERSVVWDDVTVGEGVALRGCIVTSGVDVPLMSLTDTIVMQDAGGEVALSPLSPGAAGPAGDAP
jgi:mannose-1-phosphate guanylyltransferase